METLHLFHTEGAFPKKPSAKTKGKQVAKAADSREIRQLSAMMAYA
jgi:carboxyl-terminal processing protease